MAEALTWHSDKPIVTISDYVDSPYFSVNFKVQILENKATPYVHLIVAFNPLFGNMMFINGEVQICQKDFRHYHEAMWYNAGLERIENPKVLVIGDGDGGFTKCPGAHNVEIVDRDQDIIFAGEKYFGADWKAIKEIHIMEMENFKPKHHEYDAIFLAVNDEFNSSPELETQLDRVIKWLKPNRKLVAQAGTDLDPKHLDFRSRYTEWAFASNNICYSWAKVYVHCYFCPENFFIVHK